MHGCNYYRVSYVLIGNNLIEEECLRCNKIKVEKGAVIRREWKYFRKDSTIELIKETIAQKLNNTRIDEWYEIIEDILRHLEYNNLDNHKSNQKMSAFVSV